MPELFLASRNRKKVEEMQRILTAHVSGVRVLGADDVPGYDEPVEDQPTFAGNALLKARAGMVATGLPSIADDSGLCVDALNGMPGVLSARWAGPPKSDDRNNALLLAQLADVPDERRGAHFVCAVAIVVPGGPGGADGHSEAVEHGAAVEPVESSAVIERVVEGRMDGRIIREVRGAGGFGYDVVFVAAEHDGAGRTTAELDVAEKDRISHRGRALRALAPLVPDLLR